MKTINYIVIALLLAASHAQADATAQSADEWYQDHYAPLWKENAWDKLDAAAVFYDETIYLHPPEGAITAVASREWLADAMQGWKSEGWLGSDVAEFRSDRLNASTVAFKARWRDWYKDGSEEFSCGWYVADLRGGVWVFTQYAEIDCAEHDL